MAMPPQDQRPEWLPSGFPPRSFPPGPPATAPGPAGAGLGPSAPGGGRGRWLAAIAALVALILLAAGLFAATRGGDDDDEGQLATGTSSTAVDTSVPTFDTSTTAVQPATTASIAPVTTAAASTTTPTTVAAGVLEVAPATLVLPKTDATAGATRGTLTLRNSGGAPITFTVQSSTTGVTAAPTRGNLAPGASIGLTATLDASRIPTEGPFTATLSFGGSGGARTVPVTSTTGRPPEFTDNVGEACTVPSTTCSRQIRLAPSSDPNPTPCNTKWAYAVTITDQSQITTARALARRGIANADAGLQQAAGTDIFISNSFDPLPTGTVLKFALEAVDVHGFARRLPEQTITC